MRSFDWVIYALVLGVVVWTLFSRDPKADAPEPPLAQIEAEGPTLPPPSPLDEQVLVQVSEPKDGIGTAFAVNTSGQWSTARHVVDGCNSGGLLVAPGQYVPVESVVGDPDHDLALLTTGRSPNPVKLDLESPLRIGTHGFHVGYPQGRPGALDGFFRCRSQGNILIAGFRITGQTVIDAQLGARCFLAARIDRTFAIGFLIGDQPRRTIAAAFAQALIIGAPDNPQKQDEDRQCGRQQKRAAAGIFLARIESRVFIRRRGVGADPLVFVLVRHACPGVSDYVCHANRMALFKR